MPTALPAVSQGVLDEKYRALLGAKYEKYFPNSESS
jgi:hypothetical protein